MARMKLQSRAHQFWLRDLKAEFGTELVDNYCRHRSEADPYWLQKVRDYGDLKNDFNRAFQSTVLTD